MNWLKRIFFPPPDPSLAAFEVAVNHAFAETGKRTNVEDELDRIKEELVQAIRDRDQAQSGWFTCRVCGARGEVHTCDYCHAARCRERDEARALNQVLYDQNTARVADLNSAEQRIYEMRFERDEAIADEKLLHGFLLDMLETEETPAWIAIDIRRFLAKREGR